MNPYGPALFAYPFDRAVASAFTREIVEWRSPEFGTPELLVARLVLAGALVLLAWPRRKGDPFLSLAAAAWTFAALGSVRFLPIAIATLVVALAAAVGPAVAGWLATDRGDDPARAGPARNPAPFLVVAAVVAIGVCLVGWTFIAPPSQAAAIGHRMPVAAVEALERATCAADCCRHTTGPATPSMRPAARSGRTATPPRGPSRSRRPSSRSRPTRGRGSTSTASRSR